MSKSLDGAYAPYSPGRGLGLRTVAALALHRASHLLARWASRLQQTSALQPECMPPTLEFHAEAGAAEGALYVDGQLIGYLHGVTRL